jgi:predicted PurR-regulated permease PerM
MEPGPVARGEPAEALPPTRLELDPRAALTIVAGVLVAFAVFAVARLAPDMLTRIAIGTLLALALNPVVMAAQRRFHCRRGLAAVVVGLALVAGFAVVVFLLGPPAVRQARNFSADVPSTIEGFYDLPIIGPRLERADFAGRVEEAIADLPNQLDDEALANAADRLIGGIASSIIVLVTAFSIMIDGDVIVARLRRLVPPARRERADQVGRIFYRTIGNYFAGSLFVAVLNGLFILTVGLIFGVPLAPLAAIWAMLTNLIPQIGGFLGGALFVLLALTQGVLIALICLALFLLYNQFENHVLQPAIVGKAVNLSPPTTMVAALIGGAAAGIPGALVATPLVGTSKALYKVMRYGEVEEPGIASPKLLQRLIARARRRRHPEEDA